MLVDLETHQAKRLPHPEDVEFVRLARNGSVLAAGAGDAIFLWNPATGEKLAGPLIVLSGKGLQDNSKDDFEKVALSGDGSRMIVVQKDDLKTTVWDLRKQSPPVPHTLEDQSFRDFAGNGKVTPRLSLVKMECEPWFLSPSNTAHRSSYLTWNRVMSFIPKAKLESRTKAQMSRRDSARMGKN